MTDMDGTDSIIDSRAIVDPGAIIANDVRIGPWTTIGVSIL